MLDEFEDDDNDMEEDYDGDDDVGDKDYVITGNSDTSDDEDIVNKVSKE
jgi:hypothetical protein